MIIGLVYYTVWSVLILSGTFSDGTFGDWDVQLWDIYRFVTGCLVMGHLPFSDETFCKRTNVVILGKSIGLIRHVAQLCRRV